MGGAVGGVCRRQLPDAGGPAVLFSELHLHPADSARPPHPPRAPDHPRPAVPFLLMFLKFSVFVIAVRFVSSPGHLLLFLTSPETLQIGP